MDSELPRLVFRRNHQHTSCAEAEVLLRWEVCPTSRILGEGGHLKASYVHFVVWSPFFHIFHNQCIQSLVIVSCGKKTLHICTQP